MNLTSLFTTIGLASMVTATVLPSRTEADRYDGGITCIPGEYMCVTHAKDWAGPDEIWTCNSQGELLLSAICGGRFCCQDSGSGVKCVC